MRDVFAEVKKDLDGRNELGAQQHEGKMLDPFDRRNWLIEAYQEALDLCVYLKAQLIREEAEDSGSTVSPSRQSHPAH